MQLKSILQIVAFTILTFSLKATTYTFTGPGYWDEIEYWDQYPGYVIDDNDTVIIHSRCIIDPHDKLLNNGLLVSGQDAIIEIIGDFENNGVFNHITPNAYFGITANGILTNSGTIRVSSIFDIWISASFINYGVFTAQNAEIKNLSTIENLGFMHIGENTIFENSKTLINTGGQFNLLGTFINENSNASIDNFTDFILLDGSEIELNGPMINNGVVRGNGNITGSSIFINKGDISPGFSPGTISFNNSRLVDSSTAKTNIQIEGSAIGDYDQITGNATKELNGTLNLRFDNGFTPSAGDQFPILTGPLVGTFSTVNVSGLNSDLELELVYTPTRIDILLDSPLSLDLVSFSLQSFNDKVKIKWETEFEIDFNGFKIERSVDQLRWEEIQFIGAKGNHELTSYEYIDKNAKVGIQYYRLKMENHDATFEYSNTEAITLTEKPKQISIYPNPFVDHIYFNNQESQAYRVYSDKGVLLKSGIANNVSMTNFPVGNYYIKLGDQTTLIQKL